MRGCTVQTACVAMRGVVRAGCAGVKGVGCAGPGVVGCGGPGVVGRVWRKQQQP